MKVVGSKLEVSWIHFLLIKVGVRLGLMFSHCLVLTSSFFDDYYFKVLFLLCHQEHKDSMVNVSDTKNKPNTSPETLSQFEKSLSVAVTFKSCNRYSVLFEWMNGLIKQWWWWFLYILPIVLLCFSPTIRVWNLKGLESFLGLFGTKFIWSLLFICKYSCFLKLLETLNLCYIQI